MASVYAVIKVREQEDEGERGERNIDDYSIVTYNTAVKLKDTLIKSVRSSRLMRKCVCDYA